jgi:hypothetical protein
MKNIKYIIFLLFLSLAFYIKCNDVIKSLSPTYDEPLHLMQGYTYLKTGSMQIVSPFDQPMLAKIIPAISLLFLKPQPLVFTTHNYYYNRQRYSFANLMLYYNNNDAEKMLNLGRRINIIVSIIFLWIFFYITNKTFGEQNAVFVSLLYIFNTTITAHSCLVTQDLLCYMFYFLGIFSFYQFLQHKNIKSNFVCGLMTGLLMVSKYTVVVLLFTYFCILLYFLYVRKINIKNFIQFFILQILCILIIGLIVYRQHIGLLFNGLYKVIENLQQGRSTFFFGKHSTTGFRLYFIVLFFLKTEIPLLIIFVVALIKFFIKIFKKEYSELDLVFIPAVIIFLVIASFSKTQIGHRHILPIYPILIFYSSTLATDKKFSLAYYFLVLLCILSSIKTHPYYLSYFNEFIGGNKNGWKYLTDSNIDWGQGLKQLSLWIKKNKDVDDRGIYLSYFGVADPHYYGIKYRPVGIISNLTQQERAGDDIIKNNLKRIVVAVSVTNLQSTYYKNKTIFNFLKEIVPVYRAADSIFVYDITENKKVLQKFVDLLSSLGYDEDVEYINKIFFSRQVSG